MRLMLLLVALGIVIGAFWHRPSKEDGPPWMITINRLGQIFVGMTTGVFVSLIVVLLAHSTLPTAQFVTDIITIDPSVIEVNQINSSYGYVAYVVKTDFGAMILIENDTTHVDMVFYGDTPTIIKYEVQLASDIHRYWFGGNYISRGFRIILPAPVPQVEP